MLTILFTFNCLTCFAVNTSGVMWSCIRFRSVLDLFVFFSPCLLGIWHCYWEYKTLSRAPCANMTFSDISLHTDFSIYLHLSQTWLIFSML